MERGRARTGICRSPWLLPVAVCPIAARIKSASCDRSAISRALCANGAVVNRRVDDPHHLAWRVQAQSAYDHFATAYDVGSWHVPSVPAAARVGPKIAYRRARRSAMEGRPAVAGTPSIGRLVTQTGSSRASPPGIIHRRNNAGRHCSSRHIRIIAIASPPWPSSSFRRSGRRETCALMKENKAISSLADHVRWSWHRGAAFNLFQIAAGCPNDYSDDRNRVHWGMSAQTKSTCKVKEWSIPV